MLKRNKDPSLRLDNLLDIDGFNDDLASRTASLYTALTSGKFKDIVAVKKESGNLYLDISSELGSCYKSNIDEKNQPLFSFYFLYGFAEGYIDSFCGEQNKDEFTKDIYFLLFEGLSMDDKPEVKIENVKGLGYSMGYDKMVDYILFNFSLKQKPT